MLTGIATLAILGLERYGFIAVTRDLAQGLCLAFEDAERVKVEFGGARSHPLFGRGVGHGQQHAAGAGLVAGLFCRDDAKVHDLGNPLSAIARHQDVFRLDVAMHHAFGVRRAQSLRNAAHDSERQNHIERLGSRLHEVAQRGAIDELHGKEEGTVLGAFRVAAIHHVAVAQRTQGAHFAQEPAREALVLAQILGEKLQGARFVQQRMRGQIHRTHAALAELFLDQVSVADQHARLEIADLAEQATVRGTGRKAVVESGRALRADFHGVSELGLDAVGTCRQAKWGKSILADALRVAQRKILCLQMEAARRKLPG